MVLINKTVSITPRWLGATLVASYAAGLAANIPDFFVPSCMPLGPEAFLLAVPYSIPSLIGAFFGRFWIPNMAVGAALSVPISMVAVKNESDWPLLGAIVWPLLMAGFAAGTMSYLAGKWNLVDGRPRSTPVVGEMSRPSAL